MNAQTMDVFHKIAQRLVLRAPKRLRDFAARELCGPGQTFVKLRGAELIPTLEWVLRDYTEKKSTQLTFLQIGANDGVMHDPIYHLVEKYNLRGVLVEPQRAQFLRLVQNYSRHDQQQFVFVNAAISSNEGYLSLYRVKGESGKSSWVDGLASLDKEVILKHARWSESPEDLAERIEVEQVKAISFASLYASYSIEHVDILQIDVEGLDAELILEFDVSSRRPAIVQFEHKHLKVADYEACLDVLLREGYRIAMNQTDTLAYNPNF